MSASGPKSLTSIGFLTVVSAAEHGLFGGYLVLNAVGRPLEFHCTAPVKPNRAQEILFGPTLEPFMYGEQIGQTLVKKSKLKPAFVCTDHASVMSVRPFISCPVVRVEAELNESPEADTDRGLDRAASTDAGRTFRVDGAHRQSGLSPPKQFTIGGQSVSVQGDFAGDIGLVQTAWESCCSLDLAEPFDRIREAVEEAKRGKR